MLSLLREWMQTWRAVRLEVPEMIADAEALLGGSYLERVGAGDGEAPAWAALNEVAHGRFERRVMDGGACTRWSVADVVASTHELLESARS